ncbi:uncharacterized protein LOC142344511 isoform X3 [Convolutriloba macropyga]
MVKPWLSSTPLKIRTIHDILCEIIEKEGEYKYTVINKRKHLLSFFTFEEIFIAAQLYTCFIDNDLKSIVENSQVGHAFSKVNKNLGDNVSTGDEVKTPPIKFVQVLQERVPDFFEMSSYDLQRDVFNLAFLTMIYTSTFIRGLKEGGLHRNFVTSFVVDENNFRSTMSGNVSLPSGLDVLLVFLSDNRHLPDDAAGYYFKCMEQEAQQSPEMIFVNSVYAVFLKNWNKIKLGIAKLKVNTKTHKLNHFLQLRMRNIEQEIVNTTTQTFCFSPFKFPRESNDNGSTIYTFLDSKGWTEVDKYSSDDDKRSICSSTNSKTKPRIYAMRPMCPLFFDVPVGANPNLKEFAHRPIVKMNMLHGIVCSTISEVLAEMKGAKQVLIADSSTNGGFLSILLSSVAHFNHLDEELSIVGLSCPEPKTVEKLAQDWGVSNVKIKKHSLFKQSAKSSAKLADARLIVLNASSTSESGLANLGQYFLDEDFTEGNGVYRSIYSAMKHGDKNGADNPTEETAKLYKNAIMHSLTFFPKADTIVYYTQSLMREENEEIVRSALAEFNDKYNRNKDFKIEVKSYASKFPTMIFEPNDELDEREGLCFMKWRPQQGFNGGFIAVITRGKMTKTASEILAEALRSGLLTKKDLGRAEDENNNNNINDSDNSDTESVTRGADDTAANSTPSRAPSSETRMSSKSSLLPRRRKKLSSTSSRRSGGKSSAHTKNKDKRDSVSGRSGGGSRRSSKSGKDQLQPQQPTLEEQIAALEAGKSLRSLYPSTDNAQTSSGGSRLISMMSNSGVERKYEVLPPAPDSASRSFVINLRDDGGTSSEKSRANQIPHLDSSRGTSQINESAFGESALMSAVVHEPDIQYHDQPILKSSKSKKQIMKRTKSGRKLSLKYDGTGGTSSGGFGGSSGGSGSGSARTSKGGSVGVKALGLGGRRLSEHSISSGRRKHSPRKSIDKTVQKQLFTNKKWTSTDLYTSKVVGFEPPPARRGSSGAVEKVVITRTAGTHPERLVQGLQKKKEILSLQLEQRAKLPPPGNAYKSGWEAKPITLYSSGIPDARVITSLHSATTGPLRVLPVQPEECVLMDADREPLSITNSNTLQSQTELNLSNFTTSKSISHVTSRLSEDRRKSTPKLEPPIEQCLTPDITPDENRSQESIGDINNILNAEDKLEDLKHGTDLLDNQSTKTHQDYPQTSPVAEVKIGSDQTSSRAPPSKESVVKTPSSGGSYPSMIPSKHSTIPSDQGTDSRYEPHIEGSNRAPFMTTPKSFGKSKVFVPPKKLELDAELYKYVPKNTPRTIQMLMHLANQHAEMIKSEKSSPRNGKSEDHKDKPAFSVSVKTKLATAEKQPYTKSLFDHKSDIAQNDKKNKHQQENMSPSPPVTNKSIRSSVATSSSNSATSSQGQIFSRRWNVQAMRNKRALKRYLETPLKDRNLSLYQRLQAADRAKNAAEKEEFGS